MASTCLKTSLGFLVFVGLAVVGFLLGMAIYSEKMRAADGNESLKKLVVLVELPLKNEDSIDHLRAVYGAFLAEELDIDVLYDVGSQLDVRDVKEFASKLDLKQINADQLEDGTLAVSAETEILDWLTTPRNFDEETSFRQLTLIAVDSYRLHDTLEHMGILDFPLSAMVISVEYSHDARWYFIDEDGKHMLVPRDKDAF